MKSVFVVQDQDHSEQLGEFPSLQEAWAELDRLSVIPWDESPNLAPCLSWRTCGRDYEILEYERSSVPWILVRRIGGLQVSAKGIVWAVDAPCRD